MIASKDKEPKQSEMSASSTKTAPLLAVVRTTSRAWCADRFGRNPNEQGRKSASKIGSRIDLAAVITTRSRTHGIESGLNWPGCPGFDVPPPQGFRSIRLGLHLCS